MATDCRRRKSVVPEVLVDWWIGSGCGVAEAERIYWRGSGKMGLIHVKRAKVT